MINTRYNSNFSNMRDPEKESIRAEQIQAMMKAVSELPNKRDKEIIYLYFGFDHERQYTAKEIVKIMKSHGIKISEVYIYELIKKIVGNLRDTLAKQDLIDVDENPKKGK